MKKVRIALAQINTTVGDVEGNKQKIIEFIKRAAEYDSDVLVFPEMSITGYPPEDLLFKTHFVQDNIKALEEIAMHVPRSLIAVIGFVDKDGDIYNAAAVVNDGKIVAKYHKNYLPNYGVFDEMRYFQKGNRALVIEFDNVRMGVTICEDIWYPGGPARAEALYADAQILVNLSASPYYQGKLLWREKMLSTRANDNLAVVAYVNLVGGQDELVFDGASIVLNEAGQLLARAKQFEEDLLIVDVDVDSVDKARLKDPRRRQDKLMVTKEDLECIEFVGIPFERKEKKNKITNRVEPLLSDVAEVYNALVVSLRDYATKNGMKQAVIGLSGGIDSSLVACIAVDALGRENVIGVSMPGPFSSEHSKEDAQLLAENLGIRFLTIPIVDAYNTLLRTLKPVFGDLPFDTTEENLQARIRGVILMALSNKFGWLVLTTGNKSESATGYSTLYGDTAGGYAVIKDLYKTMVYKLSEYVNQKAGREIIPHRVFIKPPSAELRENQTDQDKLPPYEVLDQILKLYVEEDCSVEEIVKLGFDEKTVKEVAKMVNINEYKRRQTPPGPKVTQRAFGKDRRLPITNGYKEHKKS
ncbi:NAD+ synthase (glutamine-hydrolysing) [Fervidobacterium changbaicum]|uniref:Glutamine-dependent NAD(+) synthetase n=1 Tax=Fervidobacterium changbaicum TaxID=310769 RepID=A0ABX5QPR2_9BACT|nr:NAD+ synthase [Fervidobacterium changbaicum]QAV32337.1 NAD+ synthase [Fervidobacterium changbaicum]SDH22019.1 NAD+ synthase (glutamine-hydrolysing) [Fervidobacterium changbaicum]